MDFGLWKLVILLGGLGACGAVLARLIWLIRR